MSKQRFCPNCGQPMAADGRFCGSCGQAVPAQAMSGQTVPVVDDGSSGLSKPVLLGIGLVALIGVGLLVMGVVWPRLQANRAEPTGFLTETTVGSETTMPSPETATAVAAEEINSPTPPLLAIDSQSPTATLPTVTADSQASTATLPPTATLIPSPVPSVTPSLTPTTPPTSTPAVDEVVFQSNRDGDFEIFIMHADGSNQQPLTANNAADEYPRVSPDGSRIVFESERDGNPEIYVMDRDGGNQTRLTFDPGNDRLPTWSPNGKQITFQSYRTGNSEIYIMDADGSNLRRVTQTNLVEGHTSWSVDDVLVFNASEPNRTYWQIYVMDIDGNNRRRLTNSAIDEWSPEWSPDGRSILYHSEMSSSVNAGIFVMDADGGNQRLLYNSPEEEWGAVWSADGTQIVFSVDQPDNTADIYIMNADGSGARRLIERGGYPSWAAPSSPAVVEKTLLIQELNVDAAAGRTDTDIFVEAGQSVVFEFISGGWQAGPAPTWSIVGPEGDAQVASKPTFPVPDRPVMSLIAGVGDGEPFVVGRQLAWTSEENGRLWLGPNDDGLDDNSGALMVRITVSELEGQ